MNNLNNNTFVKLIYTFFLLDGGKKINIWYDEDENQCGLILYRNRFKTFHIVKNNKILYTEIK